MPSHLYQTTGAPHRSNRAYTQPSFRLKTFKAIHLAALWLGICLLVSAPVLANPSSLDPRIGVSISAADYPDADSALMLDDIRFDVTPDRSSIFDEHDAVRVLNPEGIDSNASLDRIIDEENTSIEVVLARTIKADGRILNAGKATLTPISKSSKAYASVKRFSLNFPDVRVGDTVEFHLRTIHKPRPGGHFWATTYIQNPMPIVDSTFTVTIPKGIYFRTATPGLKNKPAKEETISQDGIEYIQRSWHIQNEKAVTFQQLSPPILSLLSRIEVSSFKNWSEVASYIGDQWKQKSTISEGLSLLVAGWLPAGNDPQAKASALLEKISQKRKAASFMSEELSFHRPSQVYPEDLVSLSDSALLASTVLTWAGIDNIPVACLGVSLNSLKDGLPNPDKVDRIVLELPQAGANSVWVDPETPGFLLQTPPLSTSGLAATSWDSRFKSLEGGLGVIKPASPYSSREEVAVEGRLDINGRAEVTFQLDSYGTRATNSRQAIRDLKGLSRELRERGLDSYFSNLAEQYGDRARVLSHYIDSDPYSKDPFSLALTVSVPGYGKLDDGTLEVPLPRFLTPDLRAAALNKKRDVPLLFLTPYQRDARIHLVFPQGSSITNIPLQVHKKSQGAEFVATGRISGNEVWYVGRLTINKSWVDKKHLSDTISVLRAAAQSENTVFKATLDSASTKSERRLELNLGDDEDSND